MTARARLARRLAAVLAATALLLLPVLAWDLRPALPPMPQSFSQPLPGRTITDVLDLAAWAVAVLLDLVLLGKVVQFALRKTPSQAELRLRRAFAWREPPPIARRDWRIHAAPLAPPVLRLPAPDEVESQAPSAEVQQGDLHTPLIPVRVTSNDRNDLPGVLLLGPLELSGCKKKQPRRQATTELIAYLATHRRAANRDELLEALWPGDDPRRSAARFYQAVSEGRKLLGDAFRRDRDTYALDRNQLRIDLDEFDRLRSDAEATTGDKQLALLEQAVAMFRGDPLAGVDALWAETEQRRLTALRTDLLERAGRLRLDSGDAAGALEYAEAAAALDASNERPVQLAMEAELARGRRQAVADRYERLRSDLDGRFGLEPSRETRHLYRNLLSQEPGPPRTVETQHRVAPIR
ncbi:MAG: AfsR/SARP family transcriptional regulator [Candidatus Binataceae bacterium]